MEKRTLLAVVLSVLVITIGFSIQNALFPPDDIQRIPTDEQFEASEPDAEADAPRVTTRPGDATIRPVDDPDAVAETVVFESNLLRVELDSRGAVVTSIELLEHQDGDRPVNMVLTGEGAQPAMRTTFGGPSGRHVDVPFRLTRIADGEFEFTRSFYIEGNEDEPFELVKRYRFEQNEYLFLVEVELANSVNRAIPLDVGGYAYTLSTGPQIGPMFTELDGRNEYRRFETLTQGSRRLEKDTFDLSVGERETVNERVEWAAVTGKYFALIGVPDQTRYTIHFDTTDVSGLLQGNEMQFARPVIRSSFNSDVFRFYAGPKTADSLNWYNNAADNSFGLTNLNLDEVQDSRPILGWLENILKWGLSFFYGIIPNYGVAIILLTIVVKGALYPLTRKSFTSMKRMQELNPKMTELKEKHKDDQKKQQQALAELYRKEKVNPLGGCLPMLLQIPFFIAMFGVFNNSFDLRGAVFIPGWINDLSASESILSWSGFALPVIGNDIRLLPIIFLGSQLLTSKFMQPGGGGQSGAQQKMFKYLLPAFIFFVLYNMPAGLLVYMILTNVTTGLQQYLSQRNAKPAAAS